MSPQKCAVVAKLAGGHPLDALLSWLGSQLEGQACWQAASPLTNSAPTSAANKGGAITPFLRQC